MAPEPSRLLALPRELRNMIYGHIQHEVVLCWYGKDKDVEEDDGKIYLRITDITIHNAPFPHVLQTSRLIHDEYIQTHGFTAPRITTSQEIVLENEREVLGRQEGAQTGRFTAQMQVAFQHARRLNILLERKQRSYLTHHLWTATEVVMGEIKTYAPSLSTIRVVTKALEPCLMSLEGHPLPKREFLASKPLWQPDYLGTPPPQLAGLPRVYLGEGYVVGYSPTFTPNPTDAHHIHGFTRLGAYMFSHSTDAKRSWGGKQALLMWPMEPSDGDTQAALGDKEAEERLRTTPYEIHTWEEEGCGEAKRDTA